MGKYCPFANFPVEMLVDAGAISRSTRQEDGLDPRNLAEICECWIQVGPVSEAGVLVRPILNERLDITVSGDETVRPEGNATFGQPLIDFVSWRLEDGGAADGHTKLAIHPAQASQDALPDLADQLDGNASCFAFCRNTMLSESGGPEFTGEGRRACAVADDFDLARFLVDMLEISVVDTVATQFLSAAKR